MNKALRRNISLKAASANHQRTLIQEARKTWQKKTEQLNLDLDGKKPWNLVAALNEKKPKSPQIVLEHEGKLCAGKQAANILIKQYVETSDLQVPTDRKRETRKEQHASLVHKEEPTMNSPFVTKKLENAFTMLKLRKVPSPDNITNEMLLHLGPCSKKKLLQLFNNGWRTGTVPQVQQGCWTETGRYARKARQIAGDQSHVLAKFFELLPSGRRYRTVKGKARFLKTFIPRSLHLLNS